MCDSLIKLNRLINESDESSALNVKTMYHEIEMLRHKVSIYYTREFLDLDDYDSCKVIAENDEKVFSEVLSKYFLECMQCNLVKTLYKIIDEYEEFLEFTEDEQASLLLFCNLGVLKKLFDKRVLNGGVLLRYVLNSRSAVALGKLMWIDSAVRMSAVDKYYVHTFNNEYEVIRDMLNWDVHMQKLSKFVGKEVTNARSTVGVNEFVEDVLSKLAFLTAGSREELNKLVDGPVLLFTDEEQEVYELLNDIKEQFKYCASLSCLDDNTMLKLIEEAGNSSDIGALLVLLEHLNITEDNIAKLSNINFREDDYECLTSPNLIVSNYCKSYTDQS